MKKILLLSLLLAGTFTVFPAANANAALKTAAKSAASAADRSEPQYNRGLRNRGGNRVFTQTSTVRRGRFLYRETYRVKMRNGVVVSKKLISRTRISR
jgi:Flp pilus assembly protein TadG